MLACPDSSGVLVNLNVTLCAENIIHLSCRLRSPESVQMVVIGVFLFLIEARVLRFQRLVSFGGTGNHRNVQDFLRKLN